MYIYIHVHLSTFTHYIMRVYYIESSLALQLSVLLYLSPSLLPSLPPPPPPCSLDSDGGGTIVLCTAQREQDLQDGLGPVAAVGEEAKVRERLLGGARLVLNL